MEEWRRGSRKPGKQTSDGRADKERTQEHQQARSHGAGGKELQEEQTRNPKASGLEMWLSWALAYCVQSRRFEP